MQITIIGWYGTETIGDRAILAGILSSLTNSYSNFHIYLGSLYPFFTERTLNEDYSLYKAFCQKDIKIGLFNSRIQKELDKAIEKSDLVIMGGGPLMHINSLFMIEYAFKKARKLGKKTIIMGCGVGPMFKRIHKKSLFAILQNTDLIILRDSHSKKYVENLYKDHKLNIHVGLDPAVKCILEFLKREKTINLPGSDITVNLRSFPKEYAKTSVDSDQINANLSGLIKQICEYYIDSEIRLIPMHYFHVGGDDRIFLNSIKLDSDLKNLYVQNIPLTLVETLNEFMNARFNIGMRFHSVVFQTLVSGNNFILDYTEPVFGKISGFISEINGKEYYEDRYINLQQRKPMDVEKIIKLSSEKKFEFNKSLVESKLNLFDSLFEYLP